MDLKAHEIAGSSPKPNRDAIGTLQELPHFRMLVGHHLRELSAYSFGFAQRVVRTSDEPKLLSAEQREIGVKEFGLLPAGEPGPRRDGLLACQHRHRLL